ncbi:winged helix-turn-helix domain-containing protein [Rhizobium sp. LjRoot30]|uniref:winged helix-turn-helix domain-containing protein n=1 Tax=Rhizobium sp. LjRoot30 TaxID=3342320 RepID=UPI003ED03ECC
MEEEFQFGPYVLRTSKRAVLLNGQPIPLGSRAMDILIYLVRNAGQLQTNAAIIKNSWPDTYVDEANLRVHISALRRALGDTRREPQYIANIPGRGYSFIGPLSTSIADAATTAELGIDKTLPPPGLVDRDEVIASLVDNLSSTRLLTITGPGGIGKTAIARSVVDRFGQKMVWIDLAEVERGEALAPLVAARMEIALKSEGLAEAISTRLNDRNLLLILDGCEHVVAHAAAFAEKVLLSPGPARILATSREPLRARGERVHRVVPLDLPTADAADEQENIVAQALKSPAVRLFVERADACLGGYQLSEGDTPSVVEICSRLDGIPLAIELAAARLETMGVEALAISLKDGFKVLSRGTRTALPRHRTLRATLDWSYDLLPVKEQQAIQELSLLRGWFTMETAAHITMTTDTETVLDDLVSKSLVVADPRGRRTQFRLLDTTRLHACSKLSESGREPEVLLSAAQSLTHLLEAAEDEMFSQPLEEWSQDYAQHLPSIRLAAEWAFSASGHADTAARLVVAALPLFFRLTLMEESTFWVTRAIAVDVAPEGDARSRMKLYAALGWPAMRSISRPDKGVEAWTKVLKIAEDAGDNDFQLRAVWALWVDAITSGEPKKAMVFAERFTSLAQRSADPMDVVVGKRLVATTLHWLGRHLEARDLLLTMLADIEHVPATTASGRYHLDQGVTARITLARCHWILGDRELAFTVIETAVNQALAIKHEVSLTHVLAEAGCPLALLDGRLDLAKEYASLLMDHTASLSLDLWQTYARCFEAEVAIAEGRASVGVPQLCAELTTLQRAGFTNFRSGFIIAEAKGLAQLGRHPDALTLLDDAIASCRSSGERWCLPELLRVKGSLVLDDAGPGAEAAAAECFRAALDAARADGALEWERRVMSEIGRHAAMQPEFAGIKSATDVLSAARPSSFH